MIKTLESIDDFILASRETAVLAFKNSSICPISSAARHELESWARENSNPDIFMITVQERRDLSKELSARLGVEHETPQVILVRDGKPLGVLNHYSIKKGRLDSILAQSAG
jgi:bacillithiol system protein YtxJ